MLQTEQTWNKSQEEGILEQWSTTFLKMCPFNTVPRVVVTRNHKTIFIATS